MATFKAVVLKGEKHLKSDNTTNIKIRITHKQKVDYISTVYYFNPDRFKNGSATGDNAKFVNERLADLLLIYNQRYLQLGNMAENMTVKELKTAIMKEKAEEIDFLKFAEDYQKQLIKEDKQGSERAVRGLLANLKKYRGKLYFTDITAGFLEGFEDDLKKKGVGVGGIETYMSRLRVIFNRGKKKYNDEDRGVILIKHNPFSKYIVTKPREKGKPRGKAKNNCLSLTQLNQLKQYNPVTRREELAQTIFFLMICLIGPNTKDLYELPKPNKAGRIVYSRSKTGKDFEIKLEPEAAELVKKYKGKETLIAAIENYKHYLDFQKAVNTGLKSICKIIRKQETEKIKKAGEDYAPDWPEKITSNWARHTWATIARNDCRISKDDVALCLGHEDDENQVTDQYINYDYSIIDEANRKVIDLVFGKA